MTSNALRTRRQDHGLTQYELAERVSLPQPYISRLERGTAAGSVRTWHRLAAVLDTDIGELLLPARSREDRLAA